MCQADLPERVCGSFLPRIQTQHTLHDTLCWSGMCSASGIREERRYLSIQSTRDKLQHCFCFQAVWHGQAATFIFFSLKSSVINMKPFSSCSQLWAGQDRIQSKSVTPSCSSSVLLHLHRDRPPVTHLLSLEHNSKLKVNVNKNYFHQRFPLSIKMHSKAFAF